MCCNLAHSTYVYVVYVYVYVTSVIKIINISSLEAQTATHKLNNLKGKLRKKFLLILFLVPQ